MTCTESQILLLFDYILRLIRDARSKEEAYRKVLELRARFQELAFEQFMRELGL